jgi:hypothetical protein
VGQQLDHRLQRWAALLGGKSPVDEPGLQAGRFGGMVEGVGDLVGKEGLEIEIEIEIGHKDEGEV